MVENFKSRVSLIQADQDLYSCGASQLDCTQWVKCCQENPGKTDLRQRFDHGPGAMGCSVEIANKAASMHTGKETISVSTVCPCFRGCMEIPGVAFNSGRPHTAILLI